MILLVVEKKIKNIRCLELKAVRGKK